MANWSMTFIFVLSCHVCVIALWVSSIHHFLSYQLFFCQTIQYSVFPVLSASFMLDYLTFIITCYDWFIHYFLSLLPVSVFIVSCLTSVWLFSLQYILFILHIILLCSVSVVIPLCEGHCLTGQVKGVQIL